MQKRTHHFWDTEAVAPAGAQVACRALPFPLSTGLGVLPGPLGSRTWSQCQLSVSLEFSDLSEAMAKVAMTGFVPVIRFVRAAGGCAGS